MHTKGRITVVEKIQIQFLYVRFAVHLTIIETYIEIYMQVRMLWPLATTTIQPFVCISNLNLIVKYNSLFHSHELWSSLV